MKRLGNLYLSHSDKVSEKSCSVSVGKPQIMSVAIVIPGTLQADKSLKDVPGEPIE